MTPDDLDNFDSDSDPAIEALGFGGLETDDLLRFIEGEMAPEESESFLESVRDGDADAAARLVRMRRDHELMRSAASTSAGPDLLAPLRARIARGELIGDGLLNQVNHEGIEPTDMMSKSVEELARRRRWNRRRPLIQVAAGIAVAAMAGVVVVQVIERVDWSGIDPLAWLPTEIDSPESIPSESKPVPEVASPRLALAGDPSNVADATGTTVDSPKKGTPSLEAPDPGNIGLASFGVALAWDAQDDTFEVRLASLALEMDAVLVRNLTLIESVGASGRGLAAGLARAADATGSDPRAGRGRDLQPSPIVGMIDDAPETRVRIDLAERGFRYALVIPRGEVANVIARMSTFGARGAGAATRLVPADTDRPGAAFEADAWASWSRHAEAAPAASMNAGSLVVPIAVVDTAALGDRSAN
ncbi:MAG: hypothetical protein ACYSUU_00710 [Planctomycetota bacterium]|jgi:hypothetical protein